MLTLPQTLTVALVVLLLCLAGLFRLVSRFAEATAESQVREVLGQVTEGVRERVRNFLLQPADVVDSFQLQVQSGILELQQPQQVAFSLLRATLEKPDLLEASFTYAETTAGRVQISVSRDFDGQHLTIGQVRPEGDKFGRYYRKIKLNMPPRPETLRPGPKVEDPRLHNTYITPVEYQRAFWSDLHYSQLDSDLPEETRRVELSLQSPIFGASGDLAGVLRVGFVTDRLSGFMDSALAQHQLFIGDTQGRLISASSLGPPEVLDDYDLRYPLEDKRLRAALEKGKGLDEEQRKKRFGHVKVEGEDYFYVVTTIDEPDDLRLDTWGWTLGVVAPDSVYLSQLKKSRRRLLLAVALVALLLVIGGACLLHLLRQDLDEIGRRAQRMGEFDFEPEEPSARFRDVVPILERFEAAKTVVRSMGRYLPVSLVRDLYRSNREPRLGGELRDVTVMFTDIAGFTSVAESMSPDQLAQMLGLYFEVVAQPIQERHGVIDKFIGDAVMCFWNAPAPLENHTVEACHAALEALRRADELFSSPRWEGRPPLKTRMGLHRDKVLVGHFGSPERMDFTALGDGVNLASRLEGINRFYGTRVVVSESVWSEARESFEFRRLDKVAAKGKSRGVWVFELLGLKGQVARERYDLYERALEYYQREQFQQALDLLEDADQDQPSALLRRRCLEYLQTPPDEDWDGITRWSEK